MSIKESALTAITAISNSDFVRAVTSAGASRRITVANLAKQIVEGYAGSSLAGSSQSVKSAIDSLNSKWLSVSSGSIQSITSSGIYYVANGVSDKPTATGGMLAIAFGSASTATGLYVANTATQQIYWVTVVNGIWSYRAVS